MSSGEKRRAETPSEALHDEVQNGGESSLGRGRHSEGANGTVSRKLGVAAIGLGRMGCVHVQNAAFHPSLRLLYILSKHRESGEKVCPSFFAVSLSKCISPISAHILFRVSKHRNNVLEAHSLSSANIFFLPVSKQPFSLERTKQAVSRKRCPNDVESSLFFHILIVATTGLEFAQCKGHDSKCRMESS